jgi:hypothetical protein
MDPDEIAREGRKLSDLENPKYKQPKKELDENERKKIEQCNYYLIHFNTYL